MKKKHCLKVVLCTLIVYLILNNREKKHKRCLKIDSVFCGCGALTICLVNFAEFLQIVLTVPILAAKFLEIKDCSTCAIYEAASESPPTVTPSFLWQDLENWLLSKIVWKIIFSSILMILVWYTPAGSPYSLIVWWTAFSKKRRRKNWDIWQL